MAKKAATHEGHCQLCGRFQKLPNGKLALHGYSVQWSTFLGICPGSRYLPYEQSADLLPEYIEITKRSIKNSTERISELRTPLATAEGYVRRVELRRNRYAKTSNAEDVRIVAVVRNSTASDYTWTEFFHEAVADGFREKINDYKISSGARTVLEVINMLRESDARLVEIERDHQTSYLKWLTARLSAWKLTELKPVEDTPKAIRVGVRRSPRMGGCTVTYPDGTKGYSRSPAEGWKKIAVWKEQHPNFGN